MLLLIAYTAFLSANFTPVAAAADAAGYLNSARLLKRGELSTRVRGIPELELKSPANLMPLGFVCDYNRDPGRLLPTYPVGMPMLFALGAMLFGWHTGPYFVCIGGALAAVWLCYLVARECGVSPVLSAVGAMALGASPMFIFAGIQPLSDVMATTWCVASIYAALRARRQAGWAVPCGAAFAMAVLVRPSDILVLPALAILLPDRRRLLLFALGGLPGAVWLAYYQYHLYGSPLRSGYGNIFEIFHWRNFSPTMRHYATWLPRLVPVVFLVLPLAMLDRWRQHWREFTAIVLWGGAIIVFYAYYDVTRETWWCLRFILPAFPAIILAGLLGLEALTAKLAGVKRQIASGVAALVLIVWTSVLSFQWGKTLQMVGPGEREPAYLEVCQWAKQNIPERSIVTCMAASGAFFFYTKFPVLRWDTMTKEDFRGYAAALRTAKRPVYAFLFEVERQEAFDQHISADWEKVTELRDVSVWRLAM